MNRLLEVLTYDREKNIAYVAESYRFKENLNEVTLEDKWYNTEYPLKIIEKVLGIDVMTPDKLFIIFEINADQLDKLLGENDG